MMSDVDSAKLVTALLGSDSALVTEVTNVIGSDTFIDIYGPPGLPTDFDPVRKALFFLGDGGSGDSYIPVADEVFNFYTYGRNAAEARLVFLRLRHCLHRKKHVRISIDGETYQFQYGKLLSGPQDDTEPEEGWNRTISSFQIKFIEITI